MADLHILRPHQLGLHAARSIAQDWMRDAQARWGLRCTRDNGVAVGEGGEAERIRFSGPGVDGWLEARADAFELRARLGFLLSAYRGRIEAEMQRQLDERLNA